MTRPNINIQSSAFGFLKAGKFAPICGLMLSLSGVSLHATSPLITNLKVLNGNVVVTWQGGGLTNQLQSATSPSGPWVDVDLPTTAQSVTNIMLTPAAFYRVMVFGPNAASATDHTAPGQPGGFSAVASACDTISLSWNAAVDPSPSSGIKEYYLYKNGVFWQTIPSTGGSSYSFSDTGLQGGTSYSYSVATMDNAGHWSSKATTTATTPACRGLPDSTPPTISISSPGSGASINNQVQIVASASDNVGVTSVQFYIDNLGSWVQIGTQSGVGAGPANYTLTYNTTNVANGAHNFLSRAYDAAGNSSYTMVGVTVNNVTADPGNLLWAKDVGQSPLTGEAQNSAVKTDSQGNLIVVGKFQGTITYAGTSLTSAGGYDFFIAKFTPSGTLSWVRSYGGAYDNIASSVAVDSNDNIIITGQFVGTMNLGGGVLTSEGGNNYPDLFVAKFTSSGTHVWSKVFGGSYGNYANGVAVDKNNDVFVTGDYNYQANFGGGVVQSAGGGDGFLVKFSGATGGYIWARSFGGSAYDDAEALAVDGNGDVWVSGFSTGNMDFGNGSQANNGGSDAFLAKFSGSTGTTIWGKMVGGAGNEDGGSLSVDGSGNGFLAGSFSQTLNLGIVSLSAPFSTAMFIAKYDPSGNLTWAKAIGGQSSIGGNVSPKAAAVDSSGNVIVTGTVTGEADFGNGQLTAGTGDIFAAKYSGSGNYLWSKRYDSGGGSNTGSGVTTDQSRDVIVAGTFAGTANIDGTTISSASIQTKDACLLKFTP